MRPNMPETGTPLGLIAAGGLTPLLVAREARATGWQVHAFATEESQDLSGEVDLVLPIRPGHGMEILQYLARHGITALVLAGKFPAPRLLESPLSDPAGLGMQEDRSDRALFRRAVQLLEAEGIRLLDQRQFLGRWLAKDGPLTRHHPSPSQEADIARGLALALELARLGAGQTVVLKQGVVLALEAAEGTDEAIERGCRLGGPGVIVVKAAGDEHDFRFDVPAIGPKTIEALIAGRGAVLAVETARTLILDPEATSGLAERHGLSVVAVSRQSEGSATPR